MAEEFEERIETLIGLFDGIDLDKAALRYNQLGNDWNKLVNEYLDKGYPTASSTPSSVADNQTQKNMVDEGLTTAMTLFHEQQCRLNAQEEGMEMARRLYEEQLGAAKAEEIYALLPSSQRKSRSSSSLSPPPQSFLPSSFLPPVSSSFSSFSFPPVPISSSPPFPPPFSSPSSYSSSSPSSPSSSSSPSSLCSRGSRGSRGTNSTSSSPPAAASGGASKGTHKPTMAPLKVGDKTVYIKRELLNQVPNSLHHPSVTGIEGSIGDTIIAYHVTSNEAAESIMKTGFRPSAKGMLGPGIYFARNIDECINKAQANTRNSALECKLVLDRSLVVHGPNDSLDENAVRFVGCASIHRHQTGRNDEWVVYSNSQITIIGNQSVIVVE